MYITVAPPEGKGPYFNYNSPYLLNELERAVVESNGICKLVERGDFLQLESWHNSLSNIDNNTIQADIMNGAEYLLRSTFLELKKSKESVGKILVHRIKSKIEFELIKIETGEVVGTYKATPSGYYWGNDKSKQFCNAMDDYRSCLQSVVKYMLLLFQPTEVKVLKVEYDKKNKPSHVYILGGESNPYFENLKMKICYQDSTEFNGEQIKRSKIVGTCKVSDVFQTYSVCKIQSKEKAFHEALTQNNELYCVPLDLNPIVSCDDRLKSKSRQKRLSSYVKDAIGK